VVSLFLARTLLYFLIGVFRKNNVLIRRFYQQIIMINKYFRTTVCNAGTPLFKFTAKLTPKHFVLQKVA